MYINACVYIYTYTYMRPKLSYPRGPIRMRMQPHAYAYATSYGCVPALSYPLGPPAYVSIRQHTSAYVSIYIHIHIGDPNCFILLGPRANQPYRTRACMQPYVSIRQRTSAYVSIRQHTSARTNHIGRVPACSHTSA
jgi:hypothetical protein